MLNRKLIGPLGSGKSESTLREMLYRAGVLESPFAPMCSMNVDTGECVVLDGERERIKRMTDELEAKEAPHATL